jgi:hypothetical protein
MSSYIKKLLCAVSLTSALMGCVADGSDPAERDPEQNDGKGDDSASCSIDEYESYLHGYLGKQQAEQRHNADGLLALSSVAQGNPCQSSDDAYVLWLAFAKQIKLDATEKRISDAGFGLLNKLRDANGYQEYASALKLTDDERWLIDSWNLVKPPAAGKKAIAAWSEYYGKYLSAARIPLNNAQQIFERGSEITPNESVALDALASLRPTSEAANSYEIWATALYLPLMDQLAPSVPTQELSNAIALLKRITATRPSAHYDVDEAFFLVTLQQELDKAAKTSLSERVESRLTAIIDTNPNGGGPVSAKAWLTWLSNFISNVNRPTELQKSIVAKWLAVKPCAVVPEFNEGAGRVSTALQQLGFTEKADAAALEPCKS